MVTICTTGCTRDEILRVEKIVQSLGGKFQEHLDPTTTHLVVKQTGSAKFKAAMEWGVEVVTLEWILECAKSQCILDAGLFPVPLFLGLCICTTGLYEGQIESIAKLVVKYGGKFQGNLEMETTTHLICEEALGSKYNAAVEWNIPTVLPNWILDSVEKKELKALESYVVEVKDDGHEEVIVVANQECAILEDQEIMDELDNINIESFKDEFQDLGVLFIGVAKVVQVKFCKWLRKVLATRFSSSNKLVSHIVIGCEADKRNVEHMAVQAPNARKVSVMWLLRSLQAGKMLLHTEYPVHYPAKQTPHQHKIKKMKRKSNEFKQQMCNISSTAIDCSMADQNTQSGNTKKSQVQTKSHQHYLIIVNHKVDEELVQLAGTNGAQQEIIRIEKVNTCILKNKEYQKLTSINFILLAFGVQFTPNVRQFIAMHYADVPMATELWLRCCFRERRVYSRSSSKYFQNTCINVGNTQVFANIIASITNYVGAERAICCELLRLGGGTVTKKLSRKNTHLFSKANTGMKYVKAREWGLKISTMEWLIKYIGTSAQPANDENEQPEHSVVPSTGTELPLETTAMKRKQLSEGPGHLTQFEHLVSELDSMPSSLALNELPVNQKPMKRNYPILFTPDMSPIVESEPQESREKRARKYFEETEIRNNGESQFVQYDCSNMRKPPLPNTIHE